MRGRKAFRSKVKVILLTLFAGYIFIQVMVSRQLFLTSSKTDTPLTTKHQSKLSKSGTGGSTSGSLQPVPRSNVIINSYMRSGSSFFGRLLGYRPDSFYIYEPLWKFSIWYYYKAANQICDSKTCQCGSGYAASSMVDRLRAMVSCKGLHEVVVAKMTPFYSGIPWMNFTSCIMKDPARRRTSAVSNTDKIPPSCFRKMHLECLKYKHVVSKVLRLSVEMYQDLLSETSDTKVIHLFRDPRATLNSRLKTTWYPVTSFDEVAPNAKCLCERMLDDYDAGLKLKSLYPDRFKMVFYEDLVTNLNDKTDKLYQFAGMSQIDSLGKDVFESIANFGFKSDHSHRDNSTDYSSWWRRSIDWSMLRSIDNVCSEVYSTLGYKQFKSEAELRNMTKPSFIFPPELTL